MVSSGYTAWGIGKIKKLTSIRRIEDDINLLIRR